MSDCFVCAKHAAGDDAEGGVLYQDSLVYVGHAHSSTAATAYRGHLVIEPKRHVEGLAGLTDAEAAAVGRTVSRLARLLESAEAAEHVYAFALGDGVDHLHLHVVPRYPDTPREQWGPRLLGWSGAPRVDSAEMRALVQRLAIGLGRGDDGATAPGGPGGA